MFDARQFLMDDQSRGKESGPKLLPHIQQFQVVHPDIKFDFDLFFQWVRG
jgi:hypothetical protein